MSTENDIVFDESKYKIKSRVILGQAEVPGMIKFLLAKGIVKSEKTAHVFLTVLAVVFLTSSVVIFLIFVIGISPTGVTQDDPEFAARKEAGKERAIQLRNSQINKSSINP